CMIGIDVTASYDTMFSSDEYDVSVACGMHTMSNAPYVLPKARRGLGYGSVELLDATAFDGLTDPFDHVSMGESTDQHGTHLKLSRVDQDAFAPPSHQLPATAGKNGSFHD